MNNPYRIFALCGNQSSGKSVLAKRLSIHFGGLPHLASDELREELVGSPGSSSSNGVWDAMRTRCEKYLQDGQSVILDATGQGPNYPKVVAEFRQRFPMLVIRLISDRSAFRARELARQDRWKHDDKQQRVAFTMPDEAWDSSTKASLLLAPDLQIDTTNLTPDDVFARVLDHINNGGKVQNEDGLHTQLLSEEPKI